MINFEPAIGCMVCDRPAPIIHSTGSRPWCGGRECGEHLHGEPESDYDWAAWEREGELIGHRVRKQCKQ